MGTPFGFQSNQLQYCLRATGSLGANWEWAAELVRGPRDWQAFGLSLQLPSETIIDVIKILCVV